jgi:hypothetical protein
MRGVFIVYELLALGRINHDICIFSIFWEYQSPLSKEKHQQAEQKKKRAAAARKLEGAEALQEELRMKRKNDIREGVSSGDESSGDESSDCDDRHGDLRVGVTLLMSVAGIEDGGGSDGEMDIGADGDHVQSIDDDDEDGNNADVERHDVNMRQVPDVSDDDCDDTLEGGSIILKAHKVYIVVVDKEQNDSGDRTFFGKEGGSYSEWVNGANVWLFRIDHKKNKSKRLEVTKKSQVLDVVYLRPHSFKDKVFLRDYRVFCDSQQDTTEGAMILRQSDGGEAYVLKECDYKQEINDGEFSPGNGTAKQSWYWGQMRRSEMLRGNTNKPTLPKISNAELAKRYFFNHETKNVKTDVGTLRKFFKKFYSGVTT